MHCKAIRGLYQNRKVSPHRLCQEGLASLGFHLCPEDREILDCLHSTRKELSRQPFRVAAQQSASLLVQRMDGK